MSLIAAVAGTMGGPRVSISNENIQDITVSPTNASAGYQLTSSGAINSVTVSGGTVQIGTWITPTSAAGADYDVYVSGAVTTGTVDTWLSLGSTRTWSIEATSVGISAVDITVQIRRTPSGSVIDTATISLEAEKTS